MDKPHLTLAASIRAMGFSNSYASELARGVKDPGMELALRIYDKTGAKLGPLKGKAAKQIQSASQILSGAA